MSHVLKPDRSLQGRILEILAKIKFMSLADTKNDRRPALSVWLIVAILLQAGLKLWILIRDAVPFNSDEAVVGLMASHILKGERPIFFYGQSYMGSADAYLVAAGFSLFGEQVWVIRLIQVLLYLGTILTTWWILSRLAGSPSAGIAAALLLAVPAVNMTLYTTASLGGYGEALLLGNLIIITGISLVKLGFSPDADIHRNKRSVLTITLGLLIGAGLWINGLTLVYAVPVLLYLLYKILQSRRRDLVPGLLTLGLLGLFIGSLPWWVYAVQNGLGSLTSELFGSAIAVEAGSFGTRVVNHLSSLFLLGTSAALGLRPTWEVRWILLPLIPFVVGIWSVILYTALRKILRSFSGRGVMVLYVGVGITLTAAFLFTSFGADPSGRYFLPVQISLAVLAGFVVSSWATKTPAAWIVVGILLLYQGFGNIQSAIRNPPGITTQFYEPARIDHRYMDELINFLNEKGEKRGYTNYWVSYPLAFQSDESLIFVPQLPYHQDLRYTQRDNRYAVYDAIVSHSQKVAYITSKNPNLDDKLRIELSTRNVTWQEKMIGDYLVFYNLTKVIRPTDLNFYSLQP